MEVLHHADRRKAVELLAFVFDHVIGKSVRGFNLLTLGWTDGLSNGTIQMDEAVREEILDWYVSQPSFIRLICGKQLLETGLLTSADHKYGEMSTVA